MLKKIVIVALGMLILLQISLGQDYCSEFSESECLSEYDKGFQSDSSCNSMFYCMPMYEDESFRGCDLVPRTDFSVCENSPTT